MLPNVTWICFAASYVLAIGFELVQLRWPGRGKRWGAILASLAGIFAQTIYLLNRSYDADLPPLLRSTHDWLLVLAWLAVLIYLAVVLWDRSVAVGLYVLPVVLALVISALFVSQNETPAGGSHGWAMLHAATLVLGIVGVVIGLILSVMYLEQHRRLKRKIAEPKDMKLFSLERLGRWNWWSVIVSVPLLTIGMGSGVFLAVNSKQTENPVSLAQLPFAAAGLFWLAMIVLFGWLVTARERPGGRMIALRTSWACGFLLATLLLFLVFTPGGIHGL